MGEGLGERLRADFPILSREVYGKPVVAVLGGRAVNLDAVYEQGIDLVLPICRKPMPLDQALGAQEATTNLICAGEAAAQAYALARL